LRRGTDLPDLFRRYRIAVQTATEGAGKVVLFTAIPRAGGTGRLAELLAHRIGAFNTNVREVAREHEAILVDLGAVPVLTDRRLWATDRLHLNADGHRRVAAAVLESIDADDARRPDGRADSWRADLPPAAASSRRADLATDARWVREHLLPWLGRRLRGVSSGDGRQAKDVALRVIDPG
jgi:hypothetical protein